MQPAPPPHVVAYERPPFPLYAWQTFRSVLLHPRAFWADEPFEAPWLVAVGFAWLVSAMGRLVGQSLIHASQFEANWLIGGLAPRFHAQHAAFFHFIEASSHGTLRLPLGIGVLSWPLRFLLVAIVVHGGLALVRRATSGFRGTLRICAYASVPMFFSHLPVLWVPALAYSAVQLGLGIQVLTRAGQSMPPLPRAVRTAGKLAAVGATTVVLAWVIAILAVLAILVPAGAVLLLVVGRC